MLRLVHLQLLAIRGVTGEELYSNPLLIVPVQMVINILKIC